MYVSGKKVSYKISTTKMMVKLEKTNATSMKNALTNTVAGSVRKVIPLSDGKFYVEMENTKKENLQELVRQWHSKEDVIYVSPVLLDEYGEEVGVYTNQVVVQLKSKGDYPVLQKCAEAYQIKEIKPDEFDEIKYMLTLPSNTRKNASDIANELHETGFFEYAIPDLNLFGRLGTNDTYFSNQWGLKNTGQANGKPGIDIKAEAAWTITTGSSKRKIAIVDVGVDLNHPDLMNNLLQGYDAYSNSTNGAPVNTNGDFPHGTKCAGVAAAQGDNSKGIVGVAYNCKILPVTIGAITSGGYFDATGAKIADGISWARKKGADVISMSFSCSEYNEVKKALDTATIYGRNGKGCVLVACAHNQGNTADPAVRFPANYDGVIAVGALLNDGLRKVESNYGPELDIMAPGEGIYTTGMAGTGQNTTIENSINGVYYSDFSATSAATPHVAGVAALILSIDSTLYAYQVRDIIRMTAQKLNDYNFQTTPEHPNGTWNNYVGYGLLDAQAAVQAAICVSSMSNQTISSNKFIRSCNNSFDIPTVTVTNNAKLTVKAYETTISGEFEVQSGSQFEIR
jgi:subtilisin family serine protease